MTQELIDETRLSTERGMLTDLRKIAESGGDLEFRGRYGETPVSYYLKMLLIVRQLIIRQ